SGKGGPFNFGGYCNPKVTELANQVLVESDTKKRDDLIAAAFKIEQEDVSHIPLHQQVLVWGVSKKLEIVQRPDNQILFYWAKKQ
ncbi:MAG: peptide/nickel transport system substrate-binding protein, partial [Variibacter sp.]|nr:peptide/nickel transport system substrate-binding protein [Variibacter sp.]